MKTETKRTRTRKPTASLRSFGASEQIEQIENVEKVVLTPEERVAYFQAKLTYWEGKRGRLIHKPKIANAERRITHYTEKLAEATAALA